jgi:hypothetical protein
MELECRVSVEGPSRIRHVLDLQAKSVFHAAGKSLADLPRERIIGELGVKRNGLSDRGGRGACLPCHA